MEQKIGVAYARFSSDKQNQTSIEVQIEQIEKFCQKNNIVLIEKYIDEAQSGTSDKRKNFQRMIQDSESGLFQFVIVHRNDRWARNIEDAMYYKKVLSQRGIKVLSVIESFDTKTAEGNFFNIVSMGMAEMYSKKLARESWEGLLATAHKGGVIGGNPPFGYRIAGHGKNKYYEIVPEEAEIIKQLFQDVSEGKSYNEVFERLEAKFGKMKFSKSSFFDRLRNPRYKGEYVFNQQVHRTEDNKKLRHKFKDEKDIIRIANGYPKIVEPEIFDKVQKILDGRKRRKVIKKKSPYLLNNFIRCGICGHAFVGSTAFQNQHSCIRQVYNCVNQSLRTCRQRPINLAVLDTYINTLFLNVFLKVENVKWLKELIVDVKKAKIKNNLETIERNKETMANIQNLIETKENEKNENQFSITTLQFLDEDINNLKKDYVELVKKNNILEEQNTKLDVEISLEDLRKTIRKYKPMMATTYLEPKRNFLKYALNKITMFREKFIVYINLWWLVEKDYNNELADDLILELEENRDNFTFYTFDESKINIQNLNIVGSGVEKSIKP